MRTTSALTSTRIRLLLQLLGTIAVLAWIPGNAIKLVAMMLVWAIGFGNVSRPELALMIGVNILLNLMNFGALRKGVFQFSRPDALGMPAYEFVMWGFYTLNSIRFLGGNAPQGRPWSAIVMAIAFALPFIMVSDAGMLTLLSGMILALSLALNHEPMDFAYVAYMVIMGTLIEYVGVWAGQWSYPDNPRGGVPLWFITMWGGIGLFTRRLLLPLALRGGKSTTPS
jgi:hypothetical protein